MGGSLKTSEKPGDTISLFRTLGLVEISGVEAIVEASESEEDESDCERTPIMGAEPLSLAEDELVELEAPLGFPVMTPSPGYHAAASARYASLSSGGQQLPHPQEKGFLAGVCFESFPGMLRPSSLNIEGSLGSFRHDSSLLISFAESHGTSADGQGAVPSAA